jgi:hypothetical protein
VMCPVKRIRAPLLQGSSNGSLVVPDRDPEGGPESRLWAADAMRGQEARTAWRDEEEAPRLRRRPKTSRYDTPVCASLVGVGGEGFIRVEMQIALDR